MVIALYSHALYLLYLSWRACVVLVIALGTAVFDLFAENCINFFKILAYFCLIYKIISVHRLCLWAGCGNPLAIGVGIYAYWRVYALVLLFRTTSSWHLARMVVNILNKQHNTYCIVSNVLATK